MPTLRKTFDKSIIGQAFPTFDRRGFRVDRALAFLGLVPSISQLEPEFTSKLKTQNSNPG